MARRPDAIGATAGRAQPALEGDRRGQGQGRATPPPSCARSAESKDEQARLEAEAARLRAQIDEVLAPLPNLPADDVPDGADETREQAGPPARRRRRRSRFAPKDHVALGEALGMMDFAARRQALGRALRRAVAARWRGSSARSAQFMLDLHTREFGYTEVAPPLLVRDETAFGTGQLPKFAEDLFRTTTGLWLIPTAEVPLTNLVADADPRRGAAAAALHRLDAVLPLRGGRRRQGHARHDPPAPVLQGRAGLDRASRPLGRRARAHDRLRRGGAEAARSALSRHAAVRRRHGLRRRARPTTSRSGCRARTPIARFRAAPIAATSRRGA